MRIVQHAALRPHRCAAIPYVGNATSKLGFIDTGQDLPGWDPHVYVSIEAVQHMARMIGWQPRQLAARPDPSKDEEIARLRAQVEEFEQRFAAVDVLASAGFVARKKPGRPASERQVA